MAKFDLKAYARQGAAARVAELNRGTGGDLPDVPRLEARNGDWGCEGSSPEPTDADVSRAEGGSVEADEGLLGGEAGSK